MLFRKLKTVKFKECFLTSQYQTFFSTNFQVTHLQDLNKFHWPVKIKNLTKCQKIQNLKTTANSNEILLKFVILIPSEPLHCSERLSSNPNSGLKKLNWLMKIDNLNLTKIFRKFEKNLVQKTTEIRLKNVKMLATIPLKLETMQYPIIKP